MLEKKQIIELIENTGLYFFDEVLTKTAKENRTSIKFLKFQADEESLVFEKLTNLLIPINISISEISRVLEKTYQIYYTQQGRFEMQSEIRTVLGLS